MFLSVVLWFIFGVAIGLAVAFAAQKSREVAPLIVLGIIGAMVGGAFGQIISSSSSGLNITALVIAIIGALLLIGFYRNISPQN